jgi:hypothetical protein
LAENADEERATLVDLLEPQIEHTVLPQFLIGDSPAEVDIDQMDAVFLQLLPQDRMTTLTK